MGSSNPAIGAIGAAKKKQLLQLQLEKKLLQRPKKTAAVFSGLKAAIGLPGDWSDCSSSYK